MWNDNQTHDYWTTPIFYVAQQPNPRLLDDTYFFEFDFDPQINSFYICYVSIKKKIKSMKWIVCLQTLFNVYNGNLQLLQNKE